MRRSVHQANVAAETSKVERESSFREREIRIQEQELDLKKSELKASRWWNPLNVAIFAAALAGLANIAVSLNTGQAAAKLSENNAERARREGKDKELASLLANLTTATRGSLGAHGAAIDLALTRQGVLLKSPMSAASDPDGMRDGMEEALTRLAIHDPDAHAELRRTFIGEVTYAQDHYMDQWISVDPSVPSTDFTEQMLERSACIKTLRSAVGTSVAAAMSRLNSFRTGTAQPLGSAWTLLCSWSQRELPRVIAAIPAASAVTPKQATAKGSAPSWPASAPRSR
jgi:hypothetical protein